MILVELNGGLGNQLFQYAAAKSLALKLNSDLQLDISFFSKNRQPYALDYFHVHDKIANNAEIIRFSRRPIFQKIPNRLKAAHTKTIYREPYFHFDKKFFGATIPVYLKGLRQSEKYFKPFQKEIKELLTIQSKWIEKIKPIGHKLISENSISVHIRRGDYLTKIALEVLGLLPLTYYQEAIEIIRGKTKNPKFYFFSDDIGWVKKNFNLSFDHEFVTEHHSKTTIEDFYLMSQCRHNIIANSSFSWWAAWLNNNPDKVVIAPKNWFNKGPKDTQDLIPEGWIKI